jgi:YNFM family putative membrane transporter
VRIALFLAGFATFSLLYCVQPLLPELAREFAVGPSESSLALSLSTGLLAFAILGAGALSEMVRRRSLMFGSMAGAALLTIAVAGAPDWTLLLVLRALAGLALGGVPAVAMAYLAEEIEPKGLGPAMGVYVAGTAFGGMSGRVITGLLADAFGWRWALGLLGLAGLAAAIGFILLLPNSRNFTPHPGFNPRFHLRAWAGHLRNPVLPPLFAIAFLTMGSFVALYNYMGFHLIAPPYFMDQGDLGLLFCVYLLGILASSMAGRVSEWLGRRGALPLGLVLFALGIALTLLPGLVALTLGLGLLTFGFFLGHAVASGWVGRAAHGTKAHASSLYLLAYYLGSSITGSVLGWVWVRDGWPGVAGVTLAMLGLALLAAVRLYRLERAAGERR